MENLYIIALNYFCTIIREVIAKDHGLWNVKIYMGKFASHPLFPLVYFIFSRGVHHKKILLFLFIVFFNIYSYGADTSIGKVPKQNGPRKKMKSYEDPEDIAIIPVTRVLCNACDDDLFR